jgi:hypothetical protein
MNAKQKRSLIEAKLRLMRAQTQLELGNLDNARKAAMGATSAINNSLDVRTNEVNDLFKVIEL